MNEHAAKAGGVPASRLVVSVSGGAAPADIGRAIVLRDEITIGQAEDNDLRLADPQVSRHHACVRREEGAYVLMDLGSANGTWVDGVRLVAPHVLQHGERIRIGSAEVIFQEQGQPVDEPIPTPVGMPSAPGFTPAGRAPAGRKRWLLGLSVAVAVLLIALVALALYLWAPGVYEKIGLITPATEPPQEATISPTVTEEARVTPAVEVATLEPTAPVTPLPSEEVEEWLNQAEALTRRSKFEEAIAIFEDLSRRAPDDARPEIGWAWALILDNKGAEALPHALRASELDPAGGEAAAVLARAYIEMDDQDLALAAAQKAVQLDPASAKSHAVLAEAYLINDQVEEAIDEADLALVQDISEAEAHRIRGWLYQRSEGDLGQAAGQLQIAAGLQPELWLRRHELGVLLLQAEDYATAIIAFQDALGIRPKAVTYRMLGEAFYGLAQYDQARASARQSLALEAEDPGAQALLAAAYARLGRCAEAEPVYEQALASEPDNPLAAEAREICQSTTTPGASATAGAATSPQPDATSPTTPRATQPPVQPASLQGRIAFPVWNNVTSQYDTYVTKVDGSGRRLVVEGMHQPAFSPDGDWLAVKGEKPDQQALFVVRPGGGQLTKVTEFIEDKLPSWSPDSEKIVLATTRDTGRPKNAYILDPVPFVGPPQIGRLLTWDGRPAQVEYVTWGGRGWIVYKGCDYTIEPQQCGLFTIPAEGGPWQRLTSNIEDTAPAAFRDRIAFMSNRDGNWEIYAIDSDGSRLRRLTNDPAEDGLPTWAPDGRSLAFVSRRGGKWAVWVMSPDGANPRRLFDIGGGGLTSDWEEDRISWGP